MRYNNAKVEKKSTPNLPYNMKPLGLLSFFILLVKKGWDKAASIVSSENSSYSYTSQFNAPVFSKMALFKLLEL